ncbi:fructose-2,6-bisphosphatase [Cenarchaeum symbiosum A]|uniref:Fructose-2,6-bisphosphatase n=1 Tax=Cenarchaeum symbiosum (strain A) TaxID=414004 RepID=A0RZ16_CENSY|nr:fructose-2,6-bisphosphatase [Cenarchaeum symbiosum A]
MPIFTDYCQGMLLLSLFGQPCMALVIFLRHGQARNNTERVLSGRTPGVPLTEKGMDQARKAAELVGRMDVARIYTSPIQRARQTADTVGSANNIEVVEDDRLIELEMGRFTGCKYDDIANRHGNIFLKFYSGDRELEGSGVETFAEVKKRVNDIVGYVTGRHPGENVLLVTHMDPIKAALSGSIDLKPQSLFELIVANASLNVFYEDKGRLFLRGINVMDTARFDDWW